MASKIEQVSTPELPEPAGNIFSNCLKVGDQIFLSGMTASDGTGGARGDGTAFGQSMAALEKVKIMVEAAGGTMADVVKLVVYLTDMAHRADFGRARAAYFQGRMPCSTLLEIKGLAQPGLVVEVDATAILGSGGT